jgi:hypothetical protein
MTDVVRVLNSQSFKSKTLRISNPENFKPWEFQTLRISNYPENFKPWEFQTLGISNPGNCKPWELQTLGIANPGNCKPWELHFSQGPNCYIYSKEGEGGGGVSRGGGGGFEKTFIWKTFEVYVTSCQYLFQARSKFFKHTWLCEFVPLWFFTQLRHFHSARYTKLIKMSNV